MTYPLDRDLAADKISVARTCRMLGSSMQPVYAWRANSLTDWGYEDAHRVRSLGRVGAAGDNAAIEGFLSLLHKNVLNRRRWDTRDDLRLAIITWIERSYRRRRRQDRLRRRAPTEFETLHAIALAA